MGGEGQLKNIIRLGGTETGRVTVKGGVDWAKHPDWSLKYEYSYYTPPGKNAVMMEGDIYSQEGSDLLKSRLLRSEGITEMAIEYKDGKAVRLVPFGRIKFGMHLKDGGQLKTIIKL